MRKLTLISVMMLAIIAGCKKDKNETTPTDARDKYVGVWKGSETITIPSLSYTDTQEGNQTISKSATSSSRILITSGSDIKYADMNGNSYTYQEYTIVDNSTSDTWVEVYNGSGNLSGNILSESGTVKISYLGSEYTGTWTCSMTKQ